MDADRSTMLINLAEKADKNFPPTPKKSIRTQASTNHHIEDAMGRDRLSLPINIEDLETDCHLFELTIIGGEIKNP